MARVQDCLAALAGLSFQVSHEGIKGIPQGMPQILLQGSHDLGDHPNLLLPLHPFHLAAPLPESPLTCKLTS